MCFAAVVKWCECLEVLISESNIEGIEGIEGIKGIKDVTTWRHRYEALQLCKRRDMKYGALQLWRRVADVTSRDNEGIEDEGDIFAAMI